MKTRQLGNSGIALSVIGAGTWAIGGAEWQYGWGNQDDAQSIAALHRAIELGVNWIDTAPAYGLGHAEEIVGRAIKDMPVRPYIATKCGLIWDEQGKVRGKLKSDSILKEIEASLRRLDIERIDICQIHWPIPDGDIEEAWRALKKAVKQGKIRYAAVSNFSVSQLARVSAIAPVYSLQLPYSILQRDAEHELLPYCAKHNIGIVCYSPLKKGLLTGRFTTQRAMSLPLSDHRTNDPDFKEPYLSNNLHIATQLDQFAQERGHTGSQLALAWILRRHEVTAAIAGIRNPTQIDELAVAADWTLNAQEEAEIEKLCNG